MSMTHRIPVGKDWLIQPENRNLFRQLPYVYFKDGRTVGKEWGAILREASVAPLTPLCAIACTAMIMRFVHKVWYCQRDSREANAILCVLLCVCYCVCYPCMLDQYIHLHNIIEEMGMPVFVDFTNTWSENVWIRSVCLAPELGSWCYVSCLFLSCPLSLVTVDRLNTMERLTGPGYQRQSQLSLLSCLLSFPVSSPLLSHQTS